jgi:hypothetical protein
VTAPITRTELIHLAKVLVASGRQHVLDQPLDYIVSEYEADGITDENVGDLLDEVDRQLTRVIRFLGLTR